MPKQMGFFFTVFVALVGIFLNFLRLNLLNFSRHIASRGIRIFNTKKLGFVKAVFLDFFKFMSFTAAETLVL